MGASEVAFTLALILCLGTCLIVKWRWTNSGQPNQSKPPANTRASIAVAVAALAVLALPFGLLGDPSVGVLTVVAVIEAGLLAGQVLGTTTRWPR